MLSKSEYREYFIGILLPRFAAVVGAAYLLDTLLGRVALQCAVFLYSLELIHWAVEKIRAGEDIKKI